jgi:hypothetical protein
MKNPLFSNSFSSQGTVVDISYIHFIVLEGSCSVVNAFGLIKIMKANIIKCDKKGFSKINLLLK